ncbi:MAG: oligopeptidase A, partial [Chromatiales bacterium]
MRDAANPLLELDGLPPFSRIRPEHVEPAVNRLLADSRTAVEERLERGAPYTWKNLVEPLEVLDDRLDRAWAPVSHMNSATT